MVFVGEETHGQEGKQEDNVIVIVIVIVNVEQLGMGVHRNRLQVHLSVY